MAMVSAMEACRLDMFTREDELRRKYPEEIVAKVLRIREMYNWFVANPDAPDREFVSEVMQRHSVSKPTAYSDLAVCKAMLPNLAQAAREFHRWRYNEMILETYRMAQKRKDTKTMERAASSYARHNRVDLEDEKAIPYDRIVIQPFTATEDPRVLGIKPIPNLQQKITQLLEKYGAESMDIEDVSYEEADLEFDSLFPKMPDAGQDIPNT
ncbi:MAG: hypothetical protein K2O78_00165 [Muribaculaceae bacterium]|nr:hypothetical protein [Muribaculaceae bacterium]